MNNSLYEAPQSDVQVSEPTGSRFWIVIRWIALLPAIYLSWWLAMAISMLFYFSTRFDDPNRDVTVMVFGGLVSAIAVVLTAYWVAPKAKLIVASVTYGVGFVISSSLIFFEISRGGFKFDSITISIAAGAAIVGGGFLLLVLQATPLSKQKSDTPTQVES